MNHRAFSVSNDGRTPRAAPRRFLELVASTTCLAALGLAASPQSLIESQGQALIGPGTVLPAPGAPQLTNPVGFGLWTAVRADDGRAFMTLLEYWSTGGGLYTWSQGAGLARLLGPASPLPSGTSLPTTVAYAGAISPGVRVSANGQHVLFGTGLIGPSTGATNDSGLYLLSNGTAALLVREGLAAPGTQGATVVSDLKQFQIDLNGLDENGLVSFRVRLEGGDVVGTTNDELIYRGSPGNLTVVAREGNALPSGELLSELIPQQSLSPTREVHRLADQGALLFSSRLLQGTSSLPLTQDNDQVIVLSWPGQPLIPLVREGDAGPFPGTTFGGTLGDWVYWLGSGPAFPAQNPGAQFLTSLKGGISAPGSLEALVQFRLIGTIPLARVGDSVANLPGLSLSVFESPLFAYGASGLAAFRGKLGGAVSATNDSALLAVRPFGSIQMIAREGDVAPGMGGKRFTSNLTPVAVDSSDRIWLRASVEGGPAGINALWLHDQILGLRLVGFEGDLLGTPSGEVIKGDLYNLSSQYTTTGRPAAVTPDGVALVSMLGGATAGSAADELAIVALDPQTLSASVASLSVSSGGNIELPIQTGSALAGLLYFTLGSLSGSTPGIPTDAGVLPLNPDALTNAMLLGANQGPFQQNFGQLSDAGVGSANVLIPAGLSSLAGLTATFAGLVIEIQGIPSVSYVTNPTAVQLLP